MRYVWALAVCSAAVLAAFGCGQKGPLVLPGAHSQKPVGANPTVPSCTRRSPAGDGPGAVGNPRVRGANGRPTQALTIRRTA